MQQNCYAMCTIPNLFHLNMFNFVVGSFVESKDLARTHYVEALLCFVLLINHKHLYIKFIIHSHM
jgi:hypothetical protein